MVKNDLVTHYETPGKPYYTAAGDTAARDSNIYVSSSTGTTDAQAIDWWMQAPFHAMGMMDPRLTQTAFGSYRQVKSGWQLGAAVDVLRGNPFTGGHYPVYFPGDGSTEPLTSYDGYEYPNPLQACPGYAAPSGLPVFVEVGGNMATTVGAVHSFTGNGVALAHCVIDSSNSAVGSYLYNRGAVVLIPKQPLQSGVKYVVALTVNGKPYTWSFTVGAFTLCTSVSVVAAPVSPSTSGTPVTFTGTASGCLNPHYEFWTLAAGSTTWQLAQAYSSSPTFTWSTTGLATGAYRVSVWAHDSTNTGIHSNSLGRYDAFGSSTYTLVTPGTCARVSAAATPPSPSPPGTPISITGVAAGCPNPLYQFWLLAPGSRTWAIAQVYSTNATFSWTTAGKASGTYLFSVWAHDAASTGTNTNSLGSYDAFVGTTYALASTCASLTVTATPPSPSARGIAISFSSIATGCPNPLFQFWIQAPGSSLWTVARPYSSTAIFNWSTTGTVAGIYHVSVWARDAATAGTYTNSLGSYDAFVGTTYKLT